MTAVLEAIDLAVGWEKRTVLSGVCLAVQPRERIALVGENGSGKTTLLRALAGLELPLAGTIRWEGRPLPRGADRVRTLGVLFQSELPSRFSVRELVTLGLGLEGPPSEAQQRQVQDMLEWADLASLAERRCQSLSGGEAQRSVLARALVAAPRLLLLDEPTNHLDPARQAALLGWLDRLRDSVAILLATHDLGLAASCDRVVLLHHGRMAATGTPTEVLTAENLLATLGVRVRRLDDPDGGPPVLRVLAAPEPGAWA
jgi:iron complex transport system ATP-binding protein